MKYFASYLVKTYTIKMRVKYMGCNLQALFRIERNTHEFPAVIVKTVTKARSYDPKSSGAISPKKLTPMIASASIAPKGTESQIMPTIALFDSQSI
jgi:hypothetical protein